MDRKEVLERIDYEVMHDGNPWVGPIKATQRPRDALTLFEAQLVSARRKLELGVDRDQALEIVRQVAACGVAVLEKCGCPHHHDGSPALPAPPAPKPTANAACRPPMYGGAPAVPAERDPLGAAHTAVAGYGDNSGRVAELLDAEFRVGGSHSVVQDWIGKLGLRHQGVLLCAVRGCDDAPKDDASKKFVRCYRDVILNPFCGDAKKAATFIERCPRPVRMERFQAFRKNLDHYPHHYVMHLVHALEVVGYKHPDPVVAIEWAEYYYLLCRGLHLTPEKVAQLDERLNAEEQAFAARDK